MVMNALPRREYQRFSKQVTSTKRWKTLRMEILERDGFKCRSCNSTGRLEVDHIQPVRTHPELSYEPRNLQALCPSCHTRKTRIECGHPPPRKDRQDWRQAIEALLRPDERSIITKEIKDA
jgi:5-methylcytosine-specific restriction protein A